MRSVTEEFCIGNIKLWVRQQEIVSQLNLKKKKASGVRTELGPSIVGTWEGTDLHLL